MKRTNLSVLVAEIAALLLVLALGLGLLREPPRAASALLPWTISDAAYDAWEREQYRLIGARP